MIQQVAIYCSTRRNPDRRVVTELGITPIPLDRSPFPLPLGQTAPPIFFTVQAGGGGAIVALSQGAGIVYPNYTHLPPGTPADFWQYEPDGDGWEVYGHGQVSADGRQVAPDPGVAVTMLYGAMFGTGRTPFADWPILGGLIGGDPVDLGTGLFVLDKTDLVLPDTMPLALARTYRPGAGSTFGPFGANSTHLYESYIWSANWYQEADLILPDGGRVHYVRTSPGTGWGDAVFEAQATNGKYLKSRITWNGNGWDLTLQDGSVLVQGENAPLQALRDRYGNQTTITRTDGPRGNIAQITTPNGRWIAFRYDGGNRITQATDNAGRVVGYIYDAAGRLITVTDPAGGTTQYTYDDAGRMRTLTDARGITFLTNEYDANGRVAKQTQADGTFYTFAYTVVGGKVTETIVTDPRGTKRRVTFNADGYPLTDTIGYTTALAQTVTTTYQAGTNLPLTVTDQAGRVTAYAYDAFGNPTTITRLWGTTSAVSTTLTYEPTFHHVASVTDPLGHTTTYDYDTRGNLTAVHAPLGRAMLFTYNAAGQVLTVTDPLGNVGRYTYSHGDLVAVADPLNRTLTYLIDGAGRLLSVTDPLGNVTRYAYDALNRPTSVTNALGGVTTFGYDANGNRTSVKDPLNHTTTYTYNSMDRVTARKDPLLHSATATYDPGGLPQTATDRKGQVTTTTYDVLGRPATVAFQDGSTLTYTYDAANRVSQVTDSANGTIARTYDDLDRVLTETTAQGTIAYTYDLAGRVTAVTPPGQPAITYAYDAADRVTAITQGASVTTYTYDLADRRTAMTAPNGVAATYSYDAASHLTGIAYARLGVPLGDLTYTYDLAGRVKTLGGSLARVVLPAATTAPATYNANNQLTSWNGANLTYDLNGNLTSDGASTYTWNARDQLVAIGGATTASFAYDAAGRRASKTLGGVTTTNLLSGDSVVQEWQGGSVVANHVPGLGADETVTSTDGAGTRTPLTDRLGSVLALVDDAGTVQTSYSYGPFGQTTASGQASANASQYTGRENDGTGLYYYRARYYSPTLQRFISEDPLGFGAGDTNLYAYVGNSPTNGADPSGLLFVADDILLALAVECAAGGLINIGVDGLLNYLGGRKMSAEEALRSLAEGCLLGVAGFGAAKLVNKLIARFGPRVLEALGDLLPKVEGGIEGCLNSFSADTPVALADGGQKPIGQIQVGDRVLAWDEASGRTEARTVAAVIVHDDPGVVDLTLGGERLTTTVAHPFYTRERGWVGAGQLRAGDHVRTASGRWGTVQGVALHPTPRRLYNLTVNADHTFFVGEGHWLVHNAGACGKARRLWEITAQNTDRIMIHRKFGRLSRQTSTGLWWSRDTAGHGGSVWKVFKEEAGGLRWIADADEYGDFIVGKHKGDTGTFIPWSELRGVGGR